MGSATAVPGGGESVTFTVETHRRAEMPRPPVPTGERRDVP